MCDMCSRALAKSGIRFFPSEVMHGAIRAGLNPWTTPGIDMSISRNLAANFGVSPDAQYLHWRQRAMAETTAWGLCAKCAEVVTRAPRPGSSLQKAPLRTKLQCNRCGGRMRVESGGVTVHGRRLGPSSIVKLRCDKCDITRFEQQADIDWGLAQLAPFPAKRWWQFWKQ